MATLTASFRYDIDRFNLNWYVANIDTDLLDLNVNDPWEDRYTIFTDDERPLVQYGDKTQITESNS